MSEPITPRGFEPRSLKNTLARRPTRPPSQTPPEHASPSQASQGESPVDVARSAAATDAPETTEAAALHTGERATGETAPLPASSERASAPPRVPAKQSRSRAGQTRHGGRGEAAGSGTASPAGARTRPRAPRGQIVFYLPVDLSRRLRAVAHQESKTHADVIFDAIESRLDDLDALLHTEEPTPAVGVFTRAEAKPAEPKVQVSGQIRADNLKVIDRLVEQHGADSRSQLVEVALRAHLDGVDASSR